jgi:hypothetical protein
LFLSEVRTVSYQLSPGKSGMATTGYPSKNQEPGRRSSH